MIHSCPHMHWNRLLRCGLAAVLGLVFFTAQPLAQPTSAETGKVSGKITGVEAGALSGIKVVLLQYVLNAKGEPHGNPIQFQQTGENGAYQFEEVPIDRKAVYRVGSNLKGMQVSSKPFTFSSTEYQVVVNLHAPQLTSDSSAVEIAEAIIVLDPFKAMVWITEVLHLHNPGPDVVEGEAHPLRLSLPPAMENLEVLKSIRKEGGYELKGGALLVWGNLSPGITTVAFRYSLPVALGSLDLQNTFPYPLKGMSVYAPQGNLQVSADSLDGPEQREMSKKIYDAWSWKGPLPAGLSLSLSISGVPMRQEWLLLLLLVFVLAAGGVVLWFVRARLQAPAVA